MIVTFVGGNKAEEPPIIHAYVGPPDGKLIFDMLNMHCANKINKLAPPVSGFPKKSKLRLVAPMIEQFVTLTVCGDDAAIVVDKS
jgi:hypothetical protein